MAQRVIVEKDLAVSMRDGTVLHADLYRPDVNERLPVLMNRTPYDKSMPVLTVMTLDPIRAALAGYNVLFVDCRGRFTSQGVFTCFEHEAEDGYDTVEWAAKQSWANGKVGMFGLSYMGATQWLAATQTPPSLKAIAPSITASDYHEGWTYQGGAFSLSFNVSWTMAYLAPDRLLRQRRDSADSAGELTRVMDGIDDMRSYFEFLPLREFPLFRQGAPYFFDWLDHPTDDAYWRRLSIEARHDRITVPALNFGGWYDIFLGGTIRNYLGMKDRGANAQARQGQRLILGPWAHAVPLTNISGEVDFGFRSGYLSADIDGQTLRFFDRWLKDQEAAEDSAPVRLFVMGDNVWRDEREWPLARTQWQRMYLHSRGRANSAGGDGGLSIQPPDSEPPDHFMYNPLDPVPTRGGGLCCWQGAAPSGAFDQRPVEVRSDVLVYSSEPLATDLELTGPIVLTLYAASSAPDTDFTAKLVDVSPCGYARNLTDGIIRARYRESTERSVLIQPGKVYEYTIDLWATSNVFKAGHRIRLEVSSSNFPRFDRNPNTGEDLFSSARTVPAVQTVMHERGYPSHLTLPLIPR